MDGSVLLYEADQAIRSVVAEVLRDEGYQVRVCATLQDVQCAAAANPTALAVVDTWNSSFYRLGAEQRKDIRTFAEGVPTVMMTAHAWATEIGDTELCLLALVHDHARW